MTFTSRENAITTPTRNRNASSIRQAWNSYWWHKQHNNPHTSHSQQSQVYSSYAHEYETSPIAPPPHAHPTSPSSPSTPAQYNHSYYRDEYFGQYRNQMHSYEHEAYSRATSSYVYPSSPPLLHTNSYYLDDQYRSLPHTANYQHVPHEYRSPPRVHSYLPPSHYNGAPMKRQQLSSPRSVADSPAMVGAPVHSPKNTKKVGAYKSKTIPSSKTKKGLTKVTTKKKKKNTDGKMRSTVKASERKKKQASGKMRSTAKASERKDQTNGKMSSTDKAAETKKETDGKMHSVAKAAVKKEIQKLKRDSNFKVSKEEVDRLEDAFILSRATKSCENTSKPTTDTSKVSEIYTSFEKKIQEMSNGKKRRLKIKLRIQLLEAEKQKKTLEAQRQNQFREERLKRRREIASLPAEELEKRMQQQPKQKKEISKTEKTNGVETKIEERRELSEYEKLRLQKIKRNENRLKELGLLNWKMN